MCVMITGVEKFFETKYTLQNQQKCVDGQHM